VKPQLYRALGCGLIVASLSLLTGCVVEPVKHVVVYKPAPQPMRWAPAEHPYYLHAMGDLRMARFFLARPDSQQVQDDERRAIGAIDAALNEMKQASIEDGKNPSQPTSADTRLSSTDRFHKALELLDQAHHDVTHQEDDPWVRDLQGRILHHIDEAHRAVQQAIGDALR